MIRVLIVACCLMLLASSLAYAVERELQWDDGVADEYEYLDIPSHAITYFTPVDWEKAFPVEVRFYGQRYGEVDDIRGQIVVWGPQTEKTATLEEHPDSLVVHARQQFALADVPATPGWFTVPLEVAELPETFVLALYTFSNEERGVKVGLTAPLGQPTHSGTGQVMSEEHIEESHVLREDEREWLMRIVVRSTPYPQEDFTSADLTGAQYSYYDDGEADGFVTMRKNGPMIQVQNDRSRTVDRIYVYAKVVGDWFDTERSGWIYLMDKDLRTIARKPLMYGSFANEPRWNFVDFGETPVPAEFYVLVTPASRLKAELHVGYDASSANQASFYGTAGAFKLWAAEAPEEQTNWMIRAHYH